MQPLTPVPVGTYPIDLEALVFRGHFGGLRLGATRAVIEAHLETPAPLPEDGDWAAEGFQLRLRSGYLVGIEGPVASEGLSLGPIRGPAGCTLGHLLALLLARGLTHTVRPVPALGWVDVALEASGTTLRYRGEGPPPTWSLASFSVKAPF